LDKNDFTGTLPTEMGDLNRLRFLTLDTNMLRGEIPEEWSGMEDLRVLTLHNNANINGTIPTFLGDLGDLQLLSLFSSDLKGTIPTELGELTDLRRRWQFSCTVDSRLFWIKSQSFLSTARLLYSLFLEQPSCVSLVSGG
jgi:hypothetical protein